MADNQGHIKPTADLIRRYLAGELDDKTMHALEKQALDDPFLADALEGYAMHEPDQSAALSDLGARLGERVSAGKKDAIVVPAAAAVQSDTPPEKGKVRRLDYRWAAAAVILVILTVGGLMMLNKGPGEQDIAQVPKAKRDTAVVQPGLINSADSISTPAADEAKDSAPAGALSAVPAIEEAEAPAKTKDVAKPALPNTSKNGLDAQSRQEIAKAEKRSDAARQTEARAKPAAAPPPPPAVKEAETSGYAVASRATPAPLVAKEEVHLNDKIDTILIGRAQADTTSYAFGADAARRKALAQGNKVEGVVTGTEAKYRRYSEENDLRILSGQVIDAESGQRLTGVAIRIRGTNKGAVTDTAGNFALKVEPNKKLDLDFSYVGYEQVNLAVASNQSNLNVRLPADSKALNDVVVVGYGSVRKKAVLAATPYYGDTAYRRYLDGIKIVPVKGLKEKMAGDVEISFTVMPNGSMKNFKANNPFHEEAGKAAIRNVEEGPEWIPASNGKKSTVHLRVPIELVPAQ
ncbi:carboxypeptidase-like regulatory domain-containing protein [Chitinophaga barathri]|uniref:Uncharacterized protein n=1 Tax=Chitinophaga barathri TaxID=1647451 RepID=A0A3N4MA62_9BACT|nr:carboxypeptidase-like regulatory domain-containing protein [Chitinophaga barathri]RPD40235.1 hypothetical protein EG028_16430 [Chitinophaga barathri]